MFFSAGSGVTTRGVGDPAPAVPGRLPAPARWERLVTVRWGAVDPVVLLVGAVALLTYSLLGFSASLSRDLALYTYAGQRVADGVPPYLGVMNRAGPLAHAIPGIGVALARLGGLDDVTTVRVVFMVIAAVCVCLVYLLGRDVFGSRLTGLVTAAAFLSFAGFIQYASNGPREKTPMTLFIVCALWAVTRRRWFTAGVFVSLATLCLQVAFLTGFAAAAVGVVVLAGGGRLRALARVLAGGALPVAVAVVYFAVVGALREAVDGFVVANVLYTVSDPLLPDIGESLGHLAAAYGASILVLVGGLVALGFQAAAGVRRNGRRRDLPTRVAVVFLAAALAALAWNLHEYDAWPDLFPVLPLAAVGVGGIFHRVRARVSATAALRIGVAWVLLATTVAMAEATLRRSDQLDTERQAVAAVLGAMPADTTIVSLEAPQPLVLGQRTNPTRHQMFAKGLDDYLDDRWPGGFEGFRDDLLARQPALIAVGHVGPAWRPRLEPDYAFVGNAPGWSWYARESLGEQTLDRLRAAAASVPGS